VAIGDGLLGDAALGRAATEDEVLDVDVPGREALGVAAVPRAAGMDGDGRGPDEAALRGAAADLGAGDGAIIATTSDRPTNPIVTAATPYTSSVLNDMPCGPGGCA